MSTETVWEEHSGRGKTKDRGSEVGLCRLKEQCGWNQVGTERVADGLSKVRGSMKVRSLPWYGLWI